MIRYDGKVVLITGGTAGIGLAAAALARALGAQVAIAGRRVEQGREAAAGLGPDVLFVPADVSHDADVRRLVGAVGERFGRLDVLVNNAGVIRRRPVADEDAAGWDDVMAINLRGAFLCCKHALPLLIASRGAIVNVSSALAFRSRLGTTPAYNASKAGMIALTQALAVRYGPDGVRANAVCPSFVVTDLNRDLWDSWSPEQRAELVARFPLRCLGTPEDVARAILFLASDAATWISGVALLVDGGLSAA
ncbi:MAG: glucose 1-dehydrogenase [Armatimonadetes bacterium]|nr:glucose 1-dehydrogenase [Armatimonadota bacterium]